MIVGVTGTFAAGKDTVSDYLQKKGFFHFSLSDAIRSEADKRGLPKDRDSLITLGTELRQTLSNDILARRAVQAAPNGDAVFTSIRNPDEAKFLKTQDGFILISVDAPIETRYERIKLRQRESDAVDFETFKAQEEKEKTGTGSQQNLAAVAALADYEIQNKGTKEELYKTIDEILHENRDKTA